MRIKDLFGPKLRNIRNTQTQNDGTRTLVESILVPEVAQALQALKRTKYNGVLIGGIALSFYVKPRASQDLDLLYNDMSEVPAELPGFKRTRPHAFEHRATGVEVELIDPIFIKTDPALIAKVIQTAELHDGVRVASPAGIVAMKLGRLRHQDKEDIIQLMMYGVTREMIRAFPLTLDKLEAFNALLLEVEKYKEQELDP